MEALEHFVFETIGEHGYLAVFILMLLESACIPIPSEATMVYAGVLAARGQVDFVVVSLVGTVANLVGSWLAYWVGRMGGRPMIERFGRYILLKRHDIDRAEAWFARRGDLAVFVSRLLPVIRTFISLPAGVAGMPFWRFTVYTFIGCLPWCFALTALGVAFREQFESLLSALAPFTWVVAVLTAAIVGWWIWHRLRERRHDATRADTGPTNAEEAGAASAPAADHTSPR